MWNLNGPLFPGTVANALVWAEWRFGHHPLTERQYALSRVWPRNRHGRGALWRRPVEPPPPIGWVPAAPTVAERAFHAAFLEIALAPAVLRARRIEAGWDPPDEALAPPPPQ